MLLEGVDVSIQHVCPRTGRALRTVQLKKSSIAYCLDESDRRVLVIGRDKLQHEFPVLGGVQMLTRFVSEGKATLVIVRQNITVLLSRADPADLSTWCKALTSGGQVPSAKDVQRPQSADPLTKRSLSSPSAGARQVLSPLGTTNTPKIAGSKKSRDPGR